MKKIDKLYLFLPLIFGTSCIYLNFKYTVVTIGLPGLDNIIESIINYTSIIIGVLIALFGIVVTLTDKDIMLKLQKNNDDKTIFKYGVETLVSNFLLLVSSIVMQSLVAFITPLPHMKLVVSLWLGAIVFSLISSVRTVYFLLMISFHQNDNSRRPKTDFTMSDTDRQEFREKKSQHH